MSKNTKQLVQENNTLEASLTKENQSIMTDIVCYIRSFPISMTQQELVRKDMTYMLINGQNNGQSVEEVFGEHYQTCCDDIISELPKLSTKEKLLIQIGNFSLYTSIMLTILCVTKLVALFTYKHNTFPIIEVSISEMLQMVMIIGIAICIVQYICKTSLQALSKQVKTRLFCLIFGSFAILIFLMFLLRNVTFQLNYIVLCMITIGLFIVYKWIDAIYE